jgi:type 2 lantibiotic biosynthesis protein LanM
MTDKKQQYRQAAITLANAICRDAIWEGSRCNWIGCSSEDVYGMPRAYAKASGTNFYDGTSGIAFFLLQVLAIYENALIRKTVNGALQQVISVELKKKTKSKDEIPGNLGFHTGLTGCAFVLQQAGKLLKDKQYTEAALRVTEKTMQLPEALWGLDVIDGPAGAIPALIHFYRDQPSQALKQFILRLGGYLTEKADKQANGWSWDTMPERHHNLTGFGHGAAGFATAYAELYAFTNNKEYLQIARSVIQYEDSHFNRQQQNWPDYRKFGQGYGSMTATEETVCSIAWCHGAPGIGLSRLRMYELTNDPLIRQDAEAAIQTTLSHLNLFTITNYSMCHGLFGNAELLLYAASLLQQPALWQQAEEIADECISEYLNKKIPLPNGIQLPADTHDFMLGTSGMGYFFLRLIDPARFPSVLLLRP